MIKISVFSERLTELRNQAGLTQPKVASSIGITTRTYQHYEAGEREPQVTMLVKIADFYSVSLDYLAGVTDDPTPHNRIEEKP